MRLGDIPEGRLTFMCILILAALTLGLYAGAIGGEFTNWDDTRFVKNNSYIKSLSWRNTKMIWTSFKYEELYIPMVWLSYALEYALVGLQPWLYHLDNVLLHTVNVILVFLFIKKLLANRIAALVTAALFAVHPMHVESVAWVTERKDVLYSVFYLSAAVIYLKYLQDGKLKFYFLALMFFVFSLLSKPMAVTLPAVLILIDFHLRGKGALRLLVNKLPFFALSAGIGILTASIQTKREGSLNLFKNIFLASRNLIHYLAKLIVPVKLSPYVPFEKEFSVLGAGYLIPAIAVAGLILILIISLKKSRIPFFGFGFFLITISPALQFIRVGQQNFADRFVYIPSMGIFLIGASLSDYLIRRFRSSPKKAALAVTAGATLAVIIVFSFLTLRQVPVWKNSETLWSTVLKYYPEVHIAHVNLGNYYREASQGQHGPVSRGESRRLAGKAEEHYKLALKSRPLSKEALLNLGNIYYQRGVLKEALECYRKVLELDSEDPSAHLNLGALYFKTGMYDKALEEFRMTIALEPDAFDAYMNIGVILTRQEKLEEAIFSFKKGLELEPHNAVLLWNTALAYEKKGDLERALELLDMAKRFDPDPSTRLKIEKDMGIVRDKISKRGDTPKH